MIYLYFTIPIILVLLAFFRRSNGMSHSWGDTVNRIISWSLPIGLLSIYVAWLWHFPWWVGALCTLTCFGADCIGHASAQGDTLSDNEHMGYITSLTLAITLLPFNAWIFYDHVVTVWFVSVLPLGLLGGLAYYFGYKIVKASLITPAIKFIRLPSIQWCVPGDTSWGEFFNGPLGTGLAYCILIAWGIHLNII